MSDSALWPGLLSERTGAGTVVWTGGMDGGGYLGPVRRGRVAGNTPPLYLSADGAGWPRPEGAPLLELVRGILADAGAEPSVRIAPPDPTVEVVVYRRGGRAQGDPGPHGPGNASGRRAGVRPIRGGGPDSARRFRGTACDR